MYNFLRGMIIALAMMAGVVTNAQIPAGYYDGTSGLYGEALKSQLNDIISGHTEYPYSSDNTDVWDILKESDRDPDNAANVILLHTGWSVNAAQEYNSGDGWNREHVWAKSHGDFGTTMGAGTDVHHLRPCDISVNSARNNKDFDNGGSEYIDGDGATGCYTDSDSWEPRDAVKGDVARMIFYMATRYEGENGELDLEAVDEVNNYPDPEHGKLSTLLSWHEQDPVDDFERNRNEVVYSYQGNRNPYIDHPEFVSYVWIGVKPEPSNHATSFRSRVPVSLSWQEAGDNTTHYLIQMNTSGCGSFSNPLNGNSVGDDAYNYNLQAPASSYSWLVPGGHNTYYFRIIPYNSEGYRYKTDGSVPCAGVILN